MIPEKFREVIRLLLKKTEADEVNWRADANGLTYSVNFADYSFLINRGHKNRIRIRLMNEAGNTIGDFEVLADTLEHHATASTLYELAREKAFSLDSALDDIEKELREPGSTGS